MIKKVLFAAVLAFGAMSASAQEQKTIEVFQPHWYVQAQGGAQYTEGERAFKHLVSPNVQVAGGYNFSPVFGVRLSVNAWQSKGGSEIQDKEYGWKWKYVTPGVDATFNLSNALFGYNAKRVFNFSVLAGVGANIAFDNDEACDVNKELVGLYGTARPSEDQWLRYLWDGTKCRLNGRLGFAADFRINDVISLGLEGQFNIINDHYNSKKAPNPDFYYNLLGGIKIALGKTHKTKVIEAPAPKIIERIVEKPVEKVVEKVVEKKEVVKEPIRRDVFFTISSTSISKAEMVKVEDIATYLNKYKDAKVSITGYADKGTGNAKINKSLSERRAQVVADTLIKQFGISSDRIKVDSKGDTEQPFDIDVQNRVSICVAE